MSVDPCAAVIADLEQQRDQIDALIAQLKGFQRNDFDLDKLTSAKPISRQPNQTVRDKTRQKDPASSRKSIVETAMDILKANGEPLPIKEIVERLEMAGSVSKSSNTYNSVNTMLSRRMKTQGDIIRVARGKWGLADRDKVDDTSSDPASDLMEEGSATPSDE